MISPDLVVAEPPGPGSEDMGRRAAGRSWGGALLCFGAVGQGGSDRLGCAPVPDSQPGAAGAASVLTPLSHLFGPAGIIVVVLLTVVYVVARNRSVLPVAAAAVAAGAAWALANVAKVIADRPRPYEVIADAVLRQQPAHGTSFPSSHTAVTLAVVIALVPFLARPLAAAGIAYAGLVGWSRVYLGVHYPLDVLAGAGIGMAVGGVIWLALQALLAAQAGQRTATTPRRMPGPPRPAPGPTVSHKTSGPAPGRPHRLRSH